MRMNTCTSFVPWQENRGMHNEKVDRGKETMQEIKNSTHQSDKSESIVFPCRRTKRCFY